MEIWPYGSGERRPNAFPQDWSALLKIIDMVIEANDPEELGYGASKILGLALGVSRVGYSAIDPDAETLDTRRKIGVHRESYRLRGFFSFATTGSYIDSLKHGESLRSTTCERTKGPLRWNARARVRSFVSVPVIEQGRLSRVM